MKSKENFSHRKTIILVTGLLLVSILAMITSDSFREDETRYVNLYTGEQRNWTEENTTHLHKILDRKEWPVAMIEVSRNPNTSPTETELENAWNLYNKTYETAEEKGWFSFDQGLNSGYFNWKGDLYHYPNREFNQDQETLNPDQPEFLMYYTDPENQSRKVLTGVMYQVSTLEKEGKQIGGPLTRWHYHLYNPAVCLKSWGAISHINRTKKEGRQCPENTMRSDRSYEMLHVWFVNHTESQFSTKMSISDSLVKKGAEKLEKEEFFRKHMK